MSAVEHDFTKPLETHPGVEYVTLPIAFPKAQESFKVASPEFRTPIDMEPRLKVRVSGEGIVARMSGAFGEESDTLRWTVILDSADLEVLE